MPVDEAVMDVPVEGTTDDAVDVTEPIDGAPAEPQADPVEAEGEPEAESPAEGEPEAEADSLKLEETDGRRLPDDIKKALKSVQETNPNVAGKIRDGLYAVNQFREVFPLPADARKAKEFIEQVGGEEGVQNLQQTIEEWTSLEESFKQDPASFVKTLASADGESFQRMVPSAINQWAAASPAEYRSYCSAVAANTVLAQHGVEAGLIDLHQLYQQIATPELQTGLQTLRVLGAQLAGEPWAQQAIQQVVTALSGISTGVTQQSIKAVINGIVGLKEEAGKLQQQPARNTGAEAFEKQKQEWESERQKAFEDDVQGDIRTLTLDLAKPYIEQYVGPSAPEGVREAVTANLVEATKDHLNKLPGFAAREASLKAKRDRKGLRELYDKKTAEVIQTITERVAKRYVSNPGGKAAPRAVARPAAKPAVAHSSGVLKLSRAPEYAEMDAAKTPYTEFVLGRGVKKNGQRVTW